MILSEKVKDVDEQANSASRCHIFDPESSTKIASHNEILWETQTLFRAEDGEYVLSIYANTFSKVSNGNSPSTGRIHHKDLPMTKAQAIMWLRDNWYSREAKKMEDDDA